MNSSRSDAVVVIPTYNEAQTLPRVVAAVGALDVAVDVLIVDDASPDGTGEVAESLAESGDSVRVLHRRAKQGLGPAYRAGFAEAIALGYDVVAQMDADGSHPVSALPALIEVARGGAVGVGSRRVAGGDVEGWDHRRDLLSTYGSRFAQIACGIDLKDATSGLRAWPAKALDAIDVNKLRADGFVFQVETALAAIEAGFEIVEVPIHFSDRLAGESKLSPHIVGEALWRIAVWGLRRRAGRFG